MSGRLHLHMETSCGVVLCNYGSILLLQYPQGHWDYPKGHVEDSDANREAVAARELAEETGISDIQFIRGFEERTSYRFRLKGKMVEKQVWWFIAETESMQVSLSHEHRNYMWLDWDAAEEQLTHLESKEILRKARQHMRGIGKA